MVRATTQVSRAPLPVCASQASELVNSAEGSRLLSPTPTYELKGHIVAFTTNPLSQHQ